MNKSKLVRAVSAGVVLCLLLIMGHSMQGCSKSKSDATGTVSLKITK